MKTLQLKPSTFPVLGDTAELSGNTFLPTFMMYFPRYQWPTAGKSNNIRIYTRHLRLSNLLLLDGHVSSFDKSGLGNDLKFPVEGMYY